MALVCFQDYLHDPIIYHELIQPFGIFSNNFISYITHLSINLHLIVLVEYDDLSNIHQILDVQKKDKHI